MTTAVSGHGPPSAPKLPGCLTVDKPAPNSIQLFNTHPPVLTTPSTRANPSASAPTPLAVSEPRGRISVTAPSLPPTPAAAADCWRFDPLHAALDHIVADAKPAAKPAAAQRKNAAKKARLRAARARPAGSDGVKESTVPAMEAAETAEEKEAAKRRRRAAKRARYKAAKRARIQAAASAGGSVPMVERPSSVAAEVSMKRKRRNGRNGRKKSGDAGENIPAQSSSGTVK
ncbi:hypothetical protein EDC01DRAFT_123775 [Geopyxis carbonaria]|nr:hypothetical protein EDC01DRAFT_123775 [Geopyxis carbonaria]